MYARTEDLLKIRDGEPIDARVHARLMADPRAAAELERLARVEADLGGLPELAPPADGWARIEAELDRATRNRVPRVARWAASVAVAASIVAAMLLATREPVPAPVPETRASNSGAEGRGEAASAARAELASYASLLEESARLERILSGLPGQPRLMSAGTAGTIAGLEDQVAWIDQHLTLGVAAGLEPEYREALWRQRVDVMNALVQVRYAQSQRVGY